MKQSVQRLSTKGKEVERAKEVQHMVQEDTAMTKLFSKERRMAAKETAYMMSADDEGRAVRSMEEKPNQQPLHTNKSNHETTIGRPTHNTVNRTNSNIHIRKYMQMHVCVYRSGVGGRYTTNTKYQKVLYATKHIRASQKVYYIVVHISASK